MLQEEYEVKKIPKLKLILSVIALCCVLWWIQGSSLFFHPHSTEDLHKWVESFGVWGSLVYIGLYILRPILLIPSIFFNLSSGILFGPWWGIVYLLIGGLGSALSFFLFGRLSNNKGSKLHRYGGKWGKRLDSYLSTEHSFMRMLWLRMVPIFPYDPVSLVAGCSSMKAKVYIGSTLLGMLPGAIAYNFFAANFLSGYNIGLGVVLLLAAFGIPMVWWYFSEERKAF